MEFLNIQSLNYDICNFDVTNISIKERIILDPYIKSKIKKQDSFFENLLLNEKIYSNRYMEYLFYYLVSDGYDTKTIKQFIKKVKTSYQMSCEYNKKIKINDIELLEKINKLLIDLKIQQTEENQKIFLYFNEEEYKKIFEIFEFGFKINYNLNNFLQRLIKPMFDKNFEITKVDNILNELLKYILKNNEISKDVKTYSINQILNFLNLKK